MLPGLMTSGLAGGFAFATVATLLFRRKAGLVVKRLHPLVLWTMNFAAWLLGWFVLVLLLSPA